MRRWELFWTGWVAITIGVSWITALVCIVGGAIDMHSLIKDLRAVPPEKETEHAMHSEG